MEAAAKEYKKVVNPNEVKKSSSEYHVDVIVNEDGKKKEEK